MKIFKQYTLGFMEIYGSRTCYNMNDYKQVMLSEGDLYDPDETDPVFETIILHSTYSYITR